MKRILTIIAAAIMTATVAVPAAATVQQEAARYTERACKDPGQRSALSHGKSYLHWVDCQTAGLLGAWSGLYRDSYDREMSRAQDYVSSDPRRAYFVCRSEAYYLGVDYYDRHRVDSIQDYLSRASNAVAAALSRC
ncbi:hypothetical protein [Sagittula sp. MA-2]|uniref:hypothetical protein n=1 Tax=Sagittula sp. MA-2 TaxID=3048007 RepID=UPI0024C3C17A|nr:hypothetical protein [Sagittula sp. MA-2]WHZ36537.1 hypothetical protein QNI11_05865 [Sagittula sp. MA-2]